jgi:2-polyprenyl-3-methyl-5-hydroxy-6-metoxy-1,4-benzoquinol methylase
MDDASMTIRKDYLFRSAAPSHMHAVFWPAVRQLSGALGPGTRVLDIGCGNGSTAGEYLKLGCTVVGIDVSESGIALARQAHPRGRFECMAIDDGILERLHESPFDLIVSTEVVEHLYDPRTYARACIAALRNGGRFVLTTPYHGYLKNLAIAVLGGWDAHADPLWDGGHIKFWSKATLRRLLEEAGFTNLHFRGAGRVPWLWKTMIVSADKP